MNRDGTSLMLGILAVVLCWMPLVGVALAISALAVGRGIRSGQRTAGIVCGAVAILPACIASFLVVLLLAPSAAPFIYTLF